MQQNKTEIQYFISFPFKYALPFRSADMKDGYLLITLKLSFTVLAFHIYTKALLFFNL